MVCFSSGRYCQSAGHFLVVEQVPHVKTALQRQVETTDREIDRLVYELYGLTEEEIAVVEGSGR
jgi:hypothetical protein